MNAPPVVDEDIESTQDQDKEGRRPLRLETNGNHRAGGETNERDEGASNAPFATEGKADEEEDEKDTAGKQEADTPSVSNTGRGSDVEMSHYFLRSVSLRLGRPANSVLRVYMESLNTMRRPPQTERLRRKKLRSKISP